ncbi:MAG: hypothetical protein ACRDRH_29100 [Pseudonocardia sp.]
MIAPFSHHVQRFDEITGVGVAAAQELIAEIGVDARLGRSVAGPPARATPAGRHPR